MATFTPAATTVVINTTTKFSEYRNKIQATLDEYTTNVNTAMANTATQLENEVATAVDTDVDSKLAAYVASTGLSYTPVETDILLAERDAHDSLMNKASFTANGHTREPKEYIETNTPYTMIDPSTDSLIVDGKVCEVVGDELITAVFTAKGGGLVTAIDGGYNFSANGAAGGGGSYNSSQDFMAANSWYEISFSVNNIIGIAQLWSDSRVVGITENKTYTIIHNSAYGQDIEIVADGDVTFNADITNISVKEIQPIVLPNAPFDSDTSHTIDGLGDELVVNGTFDSDTDWTKGTGWSIGSGVASCDGSSTTLTENISFNVGDKIVVSYDITSYTSGSIASNLTGTGVVDGTSHSSVGSYSDTITVGSGYTGSIGVYSAAFVGSVDNISVKEVIGLQATQAVDKGDFVVTGQELVTNGTFDSDTSGWTALGSSVLSLETNTLKILNNGGYGTAAPSSFTTGISGVKYVLTFDLVEQFGGNELNTANLPDGTLFPTNGFGTYTTTFISNGTNTLSFSIGGNTVGDYIRIDNISVKPYNEVYQATVDTADMYDIDDTSSSSGVSLLGLVLFCTGNNPTGSSGDFYECLYSGTDIAPSTTNLQNTVVWTHIGTAETMSLLNPYFNVLPRVARQDVVVHRFHKTTLDYSKHSFKGTKLFEDTASPVEIMNYYYGSPIAKGLWSDDTYYYLPLDIFERFNAGAYHPWFNEFGSAYFGLIANNLSAGSWHVTNYSYAKSVYDSIKYKTIFSAYIGNIDGGDSSRPNSEFYDKVYKNQSRDLRLLAYTPDKTTSLRNEARDNENGSAVGVDGMVECVQIRKQPSTVSHTYIYMPHSEFNLYDDIQWFDFLGNTGRTTLLSKGSDGYGEYYFTSSAVVKNINVHLYVTKKSPHSFQSYTHTDLIGNPANYTQTLKSILASGKGVLINPLLVDDRGNSLIPDGSGKVYKFSNKLLDRLTHIITNNSGDTYFEKVSDSNYGVVGTINNVIDYAAAYDTLTHVAVAQYQTKANQTISLPIGTTIATLDKFYASNSHSIYKGGNAVASGIGKIPTGNGANGFESGYLENCEVGMYKLTNLEGESVGTTLNIGDVVFIQSLGINQTPEAGHYYEWVYQDGYNGNTSYFGSTNYQNITLWTDLGTSLITPSHNTIALDNSESVASKRFYTLEKDSDGMAQLAMYTTEMAYNSVTTSYDGDSELFEQLADGTLTDDNANTIITSRTARRLNYFIGDK